VFDTPEARRGIRRSSYLCVTMTIVGEFRIPTDDFLLADPLDTAPGCHVDLVRVTVEPNVLSPFFRVTTLDLASFHDALADDPAVERRTRLETTDDTALYRVRWDLDGTNIPAIYGEYEGSVVETTATPDGWDLGVRFVDRDAFDAFRSQLREADVEFRTRRLTTGAETVADATSGLTEKQEEAIRRAWQLGYFDSPRATSLETVAEDLGISPQALSERIRRGQRSLFAHTLSTGDDGPPSR
jgi:hypothetical protein